MTLHDCPIGLVRLATEMAGRKLLDNLPANFVARRANGLTTEAVGRAATGAAETARSAQSAVATNVITMTCCVRRIC